jgi:hypothetical protein
MEERTSTKPAEGEHKMRNMKIEKKNDAIVITIDLKGETQPSASGKTTLVASTQGNAPVDGTWFVGLNCFKYAGPKAAK